MTEMAPAGKQQAPPLVVIDPVGQAAERAQHDTGGGQDQDESQVVTAQSDRPQVDDPRGHEQRQRQQRRAKR